MEVSSSYHIVPKFGQMLALVAEMTSPQNKKFFNFWQYKNYNHLQFRFDYKIPKLGQMLELNLGQMWHYNHLLYKFNIYFCKSLLLSLHQS